MTQIEKGKPKLSKLLEEITIKSNFEYGTPQTSERTFSTSLGTSPYPQ
jgi:hypothetical protein